jgi:CheY-like chemotaxis protein
VVCPDGKITISSDDKDSSDALCLFLTEKGYEVTCATNGKEALGYVIHETPDLVVLDLFMPEMDGTGFLEVVRSYLRLQSLPVIVHTALQDSPAIDHARTLKVNAILVKGKATFEEIAATIEQELHRLPS